MAYKNTHDCIQDLEKHGHLVRIKEEVDPYLEMAAIHLRVFEHKGPALFFENIKGCQFPAVSNLFGTLDRSRFIFRETLHGIQELIAVKNDPLSVLKKPWKSRHLLFDGWNALPKKVNQLPVKYREISIHDLPQIQCWKNDGGAFITLPQVYSEDMDRPGILHSNLGMYRIQLSGNSYVRDREIGLHYQLHRGIGVHQSKAIAHNKPLKVSIFVGGPPAHAFAAVMPLPEGMPEVAFAGALGGRRFRYAYEDGYALSADADFVITGEIFPDENKPEGPFGDHLGYYSLEHDFPVMRVHKVYHRQNAIWPFTVVGRPPQEDTMFGALIHELTGDAIPNEIPGLKEVHAVDAAGVHPLLLAIGSERYTPYNKTRKPQEILTIANHILGTGQMSLAKYLLIIAKEDKRTPSTHDIPAFFQYMLERIDWSHDLHFYTNTTIDTLDYSGSSLNNGSKLVMAAAGDKKHTLATELNEELKLPEGFYNPCLVLPGILAIQAPRYENEDKTREEIELLNQYLSHNRQLLNRRQHQESSLPVIKLVVLADDSSFTAATLNNFLWITFTRSNPSHDIHGLNATTLYKHWGCDGALIIDARIKPHHAPPLLKDPSVEAKVDALGKKGASLEGII